jgi:hypothetical protein
VQTSRARGWLPSPFERMRGGGDEAKACARATVPAARMAPILAPEPGAGTLQLWWPREVGSQAGMTATFPQNPPEPDPRVGNAEGHLS